MSAERVSVHRLQELVRLHRMGRGAREVARLLRMGPNTERAYRRALEAAGLLAGDPASLPALSVLVAAVAEHAPPRPALQQTSRVEPWAAEVEAMVGRGAGPQAIHNRLRTEHGDQFDVSVSAVKRYVRRLVRERGVQPQDVAIPVETEPGDVLQVDFGYAGRLYDAGAGRLRRAWVFVAVLGFSRHLVVRIVFDQRVETWLRLHEEVFAELGGVVRTVVPDNLKAAVTRAAFGVDGQSVLNRSFRELARHYGFVVDPTPPRSPAKKGKCERTVQYVKRSFFLPRGEMDAERARRDLALWAREVAGLRVHGTTGRRPAELFAEVERGALAPLPQQRFDPVVWKQAKVHRDSHVVFRRELYSVPWRLVGQQVWLRVTRSGVRVELGGEVVARHARTTPGGRATHEGHLPDRRSELRHRSRRYWEERAAAIGPEVADFVAAVFDQDDVLSQLRTVQYVVTHLERFPEKRSRAACARALHFGSTSYGAIKRILAEALDLEPLPHKTRAAALERPRYARPVQQQLPLQGGAR